MNRTELEATASKAVHLRGLNEVPIGLFLLLWLGLPRSLTSDKSGGLILLGTLVLGLVASRMIRGYYDRTFGRVQNIGFHVRDLLIGIPVVTIAIVVGFLIEVRIHDLGIAVLDHGSAMATLFGLAMLLRYALRRSISDHHLPLWGGLALLGALPVWGRGVAADSDVIVAQASLIMAGVFVVNALLDHRALVRTMHPLADEAAGHEQS